ncbi:hypothetical protein LJR234_001583 [Mesorhizobium amorphae]|uniref:hypothetical protein n=1 Tax=Mesorhizobium amorphae TaxID=71433 RepID=UPI003ECCA650
MQLGKIRNRISKIDHFRNPILKIHTDERSANLQRSRFARSVQPQGDRAGEHSSAWRVLLL